MFRNILVSILLTILLNSNYVTSSNFDCQVFSEPNFQSEPQLSLKNQETLYDLNLVFVANITTFQSIQIEKGCKFLTCSETKLNGKCFEYSESVASLNEGKQLFESVSCKCLPQQQVRKGRKVGENESTRSCGVLYENWHFAGPSQKLVFPGSTNRLEIGAISSAKMSNGCKVTVWRRDGDQTHSLTLEDDFTFMESIDKNDVQASDNDWKWACCYCSLDEQNVCTNAQRNLNAGYVGEKDDTDFADFVKHGKKIIGIGRNYRWKSGDLAKLIKIPDEPIVFMKPSTSYITEGRQIQLPESLGTIYYEIELGVVIGKRGKNIPQSKALDHVAGYFLALDMTAKEFLQKSVRQSMPWEIGKGFDTACPVSHFIPKHMIPDPNNVDLECRVNGKVTQADNTKNMIFDVSRLISYISKYMTLEPYDTIVTGTPDGLGPVKPGDIITGTLGNVTSIRFEAVALKDS